MRSTAPVGLFLLLVAAACSRTHQTALVVDQPGTLWALIVNGGRRPQENYQSHLLHVRQAAQILSSAGVAPQRIALFMSDGNDPTADVAARDSAPEVTDLWRAQGSRAEPALRPPINFINAQVDGFVAQPATLEALKQWFDQARLTAR